MKNEEIKAKYDALPSRVKEENLKISALAKGLVALNKTHASNLIKKLMSPLYRQR